MPQDKSVPDSVPVSHPLGSKRDVAEAAAYLHVSPQKIRNEIRAGRLRAARLGKGYVLDLADLDAFWNRNAKFFKPYRKGTHPWVAKRHAQNRDAKRQGAR